MKFAHIVHPTDFSNTSMNAYRFAAEIAKKQSGSLELIHVYEKPYYTAPSAAGSITVVVDSEADKDLRHEINHQIHLLTQADFAQGVTLTQRVLHDIPAWRFYEEIDQTKVDLIVMGTRGATGLMHGGLVGTNAERVIRLADTPVLSIPEEAAYTDVKRVLFATNYQDPLDEIFPSVINFCELFNADLVVGMINTRDNYATTRFASENYEALIAKFPYAKTSLVVHNDDSVQEGVADLVYRQKIDVISMLTHGRTGIAHLIRGSIAEEIAAYLCTPLLTLKNKK